MRTLQRILTAIILCAFLYAPTPAPVAITPVSFWPTTPTAYGTVYVVSHLDSSWNPYLRHTTVYINAFVASHIRLVACKKSQRCVTIRYGNPPGSAYGWTTCKNNNCTIILDRRTPRKYRNRILTHEFGHVFGLAHNKHCVSVMWPYRECAHQNWPGYFSTTEKRT